MKKVLVFSHKKLWRSEHSPTGYATDGGFVFHMQAIASLFDEMEIISLEIEPSNSGEVPFKDTSIQFSLIEYPKVKGVLRRLWVLYWTISALPWLIKKIKSVDIVHVPIPSDIGTIGMLLAKWMKKPLFIRYCGNWLIQRTTAENFWRRFMIKNAGDNMVCLVTGGDTEPPSKENENLKWIFSSSLTLEDMEKMNTQRGSKLSGIVKLVIVARQIESKGTRNIIRALPLLSDLGINAVLNVVGDGPDLQEFKKEAARLGVQSAVTFHGKLSNTGVLEVLATSDIFVFPTQSEGFPKAVLEAMAVGLPVITNPVSTLPGLVGESGSGFLMEEGSPQEIANAINLLLTKGEFFKISKNALKTARKFTLEAWVNQISKEINKQWNLNLHQKRSIIK